MRAFNKTRTRSIILVSSLVALLLALSLPTIALAEPDGPPSALEPASPVSAAIADLHTVVLIIAAGVFVIVEGLILFAAFRFRRRAKDAGEPPQIHGNTRLEIAWTVAPAVIVVALFVLAVRAQQNMDAAAYSAEPGVPISVEVIGHQWWWEFHYPDLGVATAGQMVIPVGRAIHLKITSADVIHSFWVPELSGKTDAIQGVINQSLLKTSRPGDYYGQCAELCGVSHAYMRLVITAVSEGEFAAWATSQAKDAVEPTEEAAQAGQQVFQSAGCVGCHVIRGVPGAVGKTGPDLTHVYGRPCFAGCTLATTPYNLAKWLADPPAVKAGSLMPNLNLPPADIESLVAYLQTLK
ncbi:MAG TPA: cytochrome c oxidase subunit II [Anaerolineae bacterium]|nr:cytochrome c oxidase subunit II [Anaerolineae bacterium]